MRPIREGSWFALWISMLAALPAAAEAGFGPQWGVNLSLFTPVSIARADAAVGFRFDLIYGKNTSVDFFDMGLVNRTTSHSALFVWGVANLADADLGGFTLGLVNAAGGDLGPAQLALVNYSKGKSTGLQGGIVNYEGTFNGVQIGLVNYAANAEFTVQIGAINIIREGGLFPVMIIANFSKKAGGNRWWMRTHPPTASAGSRSCSRASTWRDVVHSGPSVG